MHGVNVKVLVAMVTELCTHFISAIACNAMLLRFSSCILVLILKSQKHKFSQTNTAFERIEKDFPTACCFLNVTDWLFYFLLKHKLFLSQLM